MTKQELQKLIDKGNDLPYGGICYKNLRKDINAQPYGWYCDGSWNLPIFLGKNLYEAVKTVAVKIEQTEWILEQHRING